MEAEGVLPAFRGIAVHDCWSSYWYYNDAEHAVCNEHLLRELVGVSENHENQTWSKAFYDLLLKMLFTKNKLQKKGAYGGELVITDISTLMSMIPFWKKGTRKNPPEQTTGKRVENSR